MRIKNNRWLVGLLALALVSASGTPALANDLQNPVVVPDSGVASSSTVAAGNSFNVTYRITDDLGCCGYHQAWLYNPAGSNISQVSPTFVSGSSTDGTYRATFSMPSTATPGTYTVKAQALDLAGKYTHLQLLASVTVPAPVDSANPVMVIGSGQVSPSSVNPGGSVQLTYQLTDDLDCCGYHQAWLYNPSGVNVNQVTPVLQSGDGRNGSFRATFTVPTNSPVGTYQMKAQATDKAGKYTHLQLLGSVSVVQTAPASTPTATPTAAPTPTSSPTATPTASPAPGAMNPVGFTGGMLTSNLTLTKAGSPYLISRTIEIPVGVKLTVDPGVEVRNSGANELFWVQGEINLAGSASEPIRLTGSPDAYFILKNAPHGTKVSVSRVQVNGAGVGSLIPPTGSGGYAHISITDSEFVNLGDYSYIWYPDSFYAARNVFSNSPGFSIGVSNISAIFENNLFIGNPLETYGRFYWVQAWASYGTSIRLAGNEFRGATISVVQMKPDYGNVPINASGNYWGTTDPAAIQALISDQADSILFGGIIDVSNPLSAPAAGTPSTSLVGGIAKPNPPMLTSLRMLKEDSAVLDWSADSATSRTFQIEWTEATDTNWIYARRSSQVSSSITTQQLEQGLTYKFRVKTALLSVSSDWSNVLEIKVPIPVVYLKPDVTATQKSSSDPVALSWKIQSTIDLSKVANFVVQTRLRTSDNWVTQSELPIGASGIEILPPAGSDSFYVRVVAKMTDGQVADEPGVQVTLRASLAPEVKPIASTPGSPATSAVISAPSALKASRVSTGKYLFVWKAPKLTSGQSVSGYRVQYRMAGSSAWKTVTVLVNPFVILSGIVLKRTYDVRVSAVTGKLVSKLALSTKFTAK